MFCSKEFALGDTLLLIHLGVSCWRYACNAAPPEVRLDHTVQALVKGPRGEIAGPVVVFTICVCKEISTKHWVVCRSGSLGHSVSFVYSTEVVCESPKLSLETNDMLKKRPNSRIAQQTGKKKNKLILWCMNLSFYTNFLEVKHQVMTDSLFCQQIKIPLRDSLPHGRSYAVILNQDTHKETNNICITSDGWQIIFSPVHASLGENSCNQTASGSWCTADPTPGLCRSGSHLLGGQEAPCCGRVWTFYDTDPGAGVP